MGSDSKIKSFRDLNAWKEGHKLVLMIYEITKKFPQSETFRLTNQVRSAVVSITSNIAEGFSRNTSKEKYQFYSIAHGSLSELQNQLFIAKDVGYLDNESFNKVFDQTNIVSRLLNGLKRIKYQ
mgnify:CR=1 FL=1